MDIFDFSKSVRHRIQNASFATLFRSSRQSAAEKKIIKALREIEERRLNSRIPVVDMAVHVTDGCFFTPALIKNISSAGICLRNLPEHIFWRTERLIVYSSNDHTLPVLYILPIWERVDTEGKMIGARILNTSKSWSTFFANAVNKTTNEA